MKTKKTILKSFIIWTFLFAAIFICKGSNPEEPPFGNCNGCVTEGFNGIGIISSLLECKAEQAGPDLLCGIVNWCNFGYIYCTEYDCNSPCYIDFP